MKNLLIYLATAIAGFFISFLAIQGYLSKSGVATEIFIFSIGFLIFVIGGYSFAETIFLKLKTNKQ